MVNNSDSEFNLDASIVHNLKNDENVEQGMIGDLKILQLFNLMLKKGASDLHLVVGAPPVIRINGEMVRVKLPLLSAADIQRLLSQVLSNEQKKSFTEKLELDFSFGVKNVARFRGHAYYTRGTPSLTFRLIPSAIPSFDSLGLPKVLRTITDANNGLILVTGPTGSGKSTTIASLIDRLNEREMNHIVTLEDPIEFIHSHKNCIVDQREVGSDTPTFAEGMRGILRQDPDIVLIGELRDVPTIEAALRTAETGHLVFATLHTNSAIQTINRLINVFPPEQHVQIRLMLSFVLQGIISQQLIPRSYGKGMCMGIEVLIPNHGIRNLIREDKVHQIYSQMQTGQDKSGMITMNQSLIRMIKKGMISKDSALSHSTAPDELIKKLETM